MEKPQSETFESLPPDLSEQISNIFDRIRALKQRAEDINTYFNNSDDIYARTEDYYSYDDIALARAASDAEICRLKDLMDRYGHEIIPAENRAFLFKELTYNHKNETWRPKWAHTFITEAVRLEFDIHFTFFCGRLDQLAQADRYSHSLIAINTMHDFHRIDSLIRKYGIDIVPAENRSRIIEFARSKMEHNWSWLSELIAWKELTERVALPSSESSNIDGAPPPVEEPSNPEIVFHPASIDRVITPATGLVNGPIVAPKSSPFVQPVPAENAVKSLSMWARLKAFFSDLFESIGNVFLTLWRSIAGRSSAVSEKEIPMEKLPPTSAIILAESKPYTAILSSEGHSAPEAEIKSRRNRSICS
ncbi:MAG: hypothetical protein V4490_03405 [Pseudomonadota bacterium]